MEQSQKDNDKETPETFNISDLTKNSFEAATKEKHQTYQRKPECFNDKVINVNFFAIMWRNLMVFLLAHMTEITATYVNLYRNLWHYFLSLSTTSITKIRKERFPAGKQD